MNIINKKKALLIDTEISVETNDLQSVLESYGYDFLNYMSDCNGVSDFIAAQKPDIVFVGTGFTECHEGAEIARCITQRFPVPLVFMVCGSSCILPSVEGQYPFNMVSVPIHEADLLSAIWHSKLRFDIEQHATFSNNYLDTIISLHDEIVLVVNNHGNLTYISPKIKTFEGLDNTALIGTSVFDLAVYNEREKLKNYMYNFTPKNTEPLRLRLTTGREEYTVYLRCKAIAGNGFILGYYIQLSEVQVVDLEMVITQAERFQDELDNTKLLFNTVFQQSPIAMILCDATTHKITMINNAGCRLFDLQTPGESGDISVYCNFVPELYNHDKMLLEYEELPHIRAVRGDEFKQAEYYLIRSNGTKCWVLVDGVSVFSSDGRLSAGLALFNNITNMKMTMRSMQLTQFTVDNSVDPVLWFAENGMLVYVNDAACAVLGYNRGELLNKAIYDIDLLVDNVSYPALWNTVKNRSGYSYETVYKKSDLNTIQVEVTIKFVQFDENEVVCVFIRDISKLRQAEEKIRYVIEKKKVVLNDIHHQYQSNLRKIARELDFQLFNIDANYDTSMYERTKKKLQSMLSIHEKISRADNASEVNVNDYIYSIIDEINKIHGHPENIKICVTIDSVLFDAGSVILCGLILHELLTNIIRHAFPEGQKGHVDIVFTQRENNICTMVVKDDGVGLSKTVLQNSEKSTGMYLLHIFMIQLQGTMSIESIQGTKCSIQFKVRELERKI